ncbi:hypothetical protein Q8A67_015654 [Cirrhinus molitorella]|uniref:Uncharacterized protein n=1 Tax=Cirrhinus molitorella TaxID=172907 RepID=A0AA88PLL5_9TELE|nr:hypothetical protein Q8A67_015654 [Cirrhinus molitorella]
MEGGERDKQKERGRESISRRYEDDMLINEYSRHSAIRPAPHPPSPASSPPSLPFPTSPKGTECRFVFQQAPPLHCCLH